MQLQTAERKRVKLRLNIASPSGFGKTYSALLIAYGMCQDWTKIGVIDTENESASLYAHLGKFKTLKLDPPFSPDRYIQAIKVCEEAGLEIIIIDSITHVWKGQGGLLEYQNSLGGRYQDWAKATPLYSKWLNNILQSKCHVITTVRKKQSYSIEMENNKAKVVKQGMDDEIRDGYDYEMTLALEIINDKHLCKASKDRTELFTDKPEFVITVETGKLIMNWCNQGIETVHQQSASINDLTAKINACKSVDELLTLYHSQTNTVKEQYATLFSQKRKQFVVQAPNEATHISQHLKVSGNGTISNKT
ncbi:MAG: ATP-binding protein [Chitinophagaceae bacterium]|nr:ATP-binding protein [Chitinophagaceae bacterium]